MPDSVKQELMESCRECPEAFRYSVSDAYDAIFEGENALNEGLVSTGVGLYAGYRGVKWLADKAFGSDDDKKPEENKPEDSANNQQNNQNQGGSGNNQETIPVNPSALANSKDADAVAGAIKQAQQAQTQANAVQQQANDAQQQADQQTQALRDTLVANGNEQQNNNGQQNAQA